MSSKLEARKNLDAVGLAILAAFVAVAFAAIIAALHLGWFRSPWELAGWLAVCAAFVAVGLPGQAKQQQGIAESRWANRSDLTTHKIGDDVRSLSDDGIYLGTFADVSGTMHLRYRGEKHLLCFGPTRSGKSASIITPNLQNQRRSMIVIDPKGELAALTANHRGNPDFFGKTIILNPFRVLVKSHPHLESAGWNPLAQLNPDDDDFDGDAMCIADAIIEMDAKGKDFFDRSAKNLTQALIMWERLQQGPSATLRNIPPMLSGVIINPETKERKSHLLITLEKMSESDNYTIKDISGRWLERLNDAGSQSTSIRDVIETLSSHFGFIGSINLAVDMDEGQAINFERLHREVTTIYLILPLTELKTRAKWLRIFINLALRNLYKFPPTKDNPATLPPILFMLDEFGNLGRLEEVAKGLNMAAFSRIQLMFFLQDISQITGPYKAEAGSFYSNVGATTTFKTGAMDVETAERLAKAFGNQEMRIQTDAMTGGGSLTPQSVPLIRAEDIARLKPGETISIIEPCPWPVRARAPIYPETRFAEGLDPHPFHG